MTAYDNGFETGFAGYCCEETGVAFADCEAGGERGGGGRRLDVVVEEGDHIVRDVVMEPSEDRPSLVGGREKRGGELGG